MFLLHCGIGAALCWLPWGIAAVVGVVWAILGVVALFVIDISRHDQEDK